ncbi:MAG: family 16 glycoside hydrolase, partial [Candidatus Binatia bacterium]
MKMFALTIMAMMIMVLLTDSTAFAEIINFDEAKSGQIPEGWVASVTGNGAPKWAVEADATAPSKPNVLTQSGEGTFPRLVKKDISLTNGLVEMKFKPIAGKKDQAAGIVWRFRDANNYYVVRANALENNVVLYKVENGKRTSLDIKGRKGGYGVEATVPSGQWSTLRVTFSGPLFAVFLNDQSLFEVEDSTFSKAGAVGLWTKADSVT